MIQASRLPLLLGVLASLGFGPVRVGADEPVAGTPPTAEAIAFFETRIRPVLAERCLGCHGVEKQSSGLRLDSREAVLRGGNTGPALVPGDPDDSTLILAIEHEDELLKMPPEQKLSGGEIEAFAAWIAMGAPWPSSTAPVEVGTDPSRDHWAFRPVRSPVPPEVEAAGWVATPVDAFLLARLEAEGLSPSPQADRRTLIRRATFDLLGLPPTPEEVEAFVDDPAADLEAFARLVDRLLGSPRYGERWGRHWLDVARYADTKGYVFQEERRYPYSYTYRDYVIGAFNADLPYDRFLTEQVAADLLPEAESDPRTLTALGFLTVGRRFLNNEQDLIDDRIDVVSRGFLGLTVACARCHDHKYDPIPTEDYYSLYGVFNSSMEPESLPLIGEAPTGPEADDYRRQVEERRQEVSKFEEGLRDRLRGELRSKASAYLLAAFDLEFNPRHPELDRRSREDELRPELLGAFMASLRKSLDGARDDDPILGPWKAFATLPAEDFAAGAARLVGSFEPDAGPTLSMALAEPTPPASFREFVGRLGTLLERAAESPGSEADPLLASIRDRLSAADGPFGFLDGDLGGQRLINRADRNKLRAVTKKVDELAVTHAGAPPRAMVLVDRPSPIEPRVLLRGNPGRPGKTVPRRFLAVLSGPERRPFTQGSGRLELARAIADPDNPLTARVMVNRIWMRHFGEGLVRTPSDFGLRSEPPTHPELLDFLAREFVEGGWSIKRMHRLIMLSNAYRQSSLLRPDCVEIDPENRLVWRQDRRRLEFEPLRDAILAVSGRLDPAMGGRPVPITTEPFSTRRTVFGYIDRQNLEGVFRTFDLPSPDATSPRRFETTVPQQALFLMNSPFVVEQARHLADRAGQIAGTDELDGRVQALYRILFGRPAEPHEVELAGRYLASASATASGPQAPDGDRLSPWEAYAQVLLLTNEFLYVD